MDNEHWRAARAGITDITALYHGHEPTIEHKLALMQTDALLAIGDVLESIDDALRNTIGGVPR